MQHGNIPVTLVGLFMNCIEILRNKYGGEDKIGTHFGRKWCESVGCDHVSLQV